MKNAPTGVGARENRQGCCPALTKKASSAKPGRNFLQHQFYQDHTALVKVNVSNGAEWRKCFVAASLPRRLAAKP
jgi:hypothetical protein